MADIVRVYQNIENGYTAELGTHFICKNTLVELIIAVKSQFPRTEIYYGDWYSTVFTKRFTIS